MRILHTMLSCFYIDNANYQENIIPRINKEDGHEVKIIASTEVFLKNRILGYTTPGSYLNEDGIPVTRLPYRSFIHQSISKKVRAYSDLYRLIAEFKPDVILFHGASAYALFAVAKYKKNFPSVKFYVDSHEDFFNSATNFLSRELLHKLFYKIIVKRCLPYIDKVFYITYDTFNFLKSAYDIPEKSLQFFPLGGIIPSSGKRSAVREKIRSELKLSEDQTILIHSGKFDIKKKTHEIISAFIQVPDKNMRLLLIGSMDEEEKVLTESLINSDSRICFLGWLNGDQLQDYLCAGDLYVQLGSQSVTMQNALCCGCTAALYPFESHKFLLKESVFYIEDKDDLIKLLSAISSDRTILEIKRSESFNIAKNVLDYRHISSIIYNDKN